MLGITWQTGYHYNQKGFFFTTYSIKIMIILHDENEKIGSYVQ